MTSEKPKEQKLPDEEHLKQAAASAQKALEAQGAAQSLRETAKSMTDPKKREKLLRDAYGKEIEAHGDSKKARMLQSGAFQGATGGAGIGGVVSMGVGTVVGTLVGGLTAIPATGLGALVGAGAGAIHGPWIKLPKPGGGGKEKGDKKDEGEGQDGDEDGEKGEKGDGDEEDEYDGVVPNPEALRQAADAVAREREKQKDKSQKETQDKAHEGRKQTGEKRKPRKIEIRSGKGNTGGPPASTATATQA